jgi:hypothetical protein
MSGQVYSDTSFLRACESPIPEASHRFKIAIFEYFIAIGGFSKMSLIIFHLSSTYFYLIGYHYQNFTMDILTRLGCSSCVFMADLVYFHFLTTYSFSNMVKSYNYLSFLYYNH